MAEGERVYLVLTARHTTEVQPKIAIVDLPIGWSVGLARRRTTGGRTLLSALLDREAANAMWRIFWRRKLVPADEASRARRADRDRTGYEPPGAAAGGSVKRHFPGDRRAAMSCIRLRVARTTFTGDNAVPHAGLVTVPHTHACALHLVATGWTAQGYTFTPREQH